MTRIAIISDIHGNLPALEAVLADIKDRNINQIICLGDLAGKGPSSNEVVDIIRSQCAHVVKGNWDHYMTDMRIDSEMILWHRKTLGAERVNYLNALPVYVEFYMSGKLVRLCHASPNDIFHRTYLHTVKAERLKLFMPTETLDQMSDVVGYGDIHGAHVDHFEGKTIFNVGSVGNPLEIPQASYGILEGVYDSRQLSAISVALVRVPYDIELAISQALETDMPDQAAYIKELRTAEYRGR